MKLLRTHTHAKHRNGAKVAALVAAALLAASSAGCAEVSQTLRGIDNAVLVALGGQPQGGDSGEDWPWPAVLCGHEQEGRDTRAEILAQRNLNAAIKLCAPEFGDDGEYANFGTFTPLAAAAAFGNAKDIKTLLARGANINARDPNSYTPLMLALIHGNTRNIQPLLANGADVNATTAWGETALSLVREDDDAIRALQAAGAKKNPIAEGAADAYGNTALMLAAKQGDTKEMQRLIAAGADVSAANQAGNTALMMAAGEGEINAVKMLLDKGANVNAANQAGTTALLVAAWAGETNVVNVLLAKGANVNAANREGETALMGAAEKCDIKGNEHYCRADMVKLLLAKGADVHARDKQGKTALRRAEVAAEVSGDGSYWKNIMAALKSAAKKSSGKKRK